MTFVLFLPQSNIDDLEVFREEKLSSGIIFLSLFLLFPNVFASSLPFSFSPGAGGCSNTRPPSFLLVYDRATSSTTDSSRAPSSPRPPGSTSHCGISTGCTERCLCILLLRTSQVDVMAPQHHQEKFHDLAYSYLGKSFSMSNQDLYGYSTNSLVLGLAWLRPKRRMYFIQLDWIPSEKPSQLTKR
uniref:MIR9-1 host n=1 Tax=Macaca mulatta TaxID=9544 RepID=A0A5F7ZXF4_MACMU